ncbi:MAG TPA: YebC/PmpR family DNA-binding transcriptional regulator [Candidatus Saccharimonadales bacterium]|nr:YebC/PmpR family DNA-binding transcriptional regulator [Candidatus Saccharimonadales bacterium]
MSGHSKWATIKRAKGANDAKRGQLFTKLSKAISIAVRQGGGVADPDSNFRLRLAIEAARTANMPKDNIERAISRASGKQAEIIEEATYEGFGPGGFSVVVEAYTDNKLRTVSEVKNIFNKNGGNMGAQGSVMYQFEKKGVITVAKDGKSIDDIFLVAADNGVDDIEEAGDEVLMYTKPEDVTKVKDALSQNELNVTTFELVFRPVVNSAITDKSAVEKALSFIDKLESLDDVQKVYANFDIPDELLD